MVTPSKRAQQLAPHLTPSQAADEYAGAHLSTTMCWTHAAALCALPAVSQHAQKAAQSALMQC